MKSARLQTALPFLLILLLSLAEWTSGAKILCFMGMSSHSHRVAIQPLLDKLAERNHEVTMFSPMVPEVPNPKIKDYCTKALKEANAKMIDESTTAAALGRIKDRNYDPFLEGNTLWDIFLNLAESMLKDPEFIDWIENSKFDLIIYDYAGKEFLYAVAHKMKAKVIAFLSMGTQQPNDFDTWGFPIETWFVDFVGNKYSYLPDRYYNTISPIVWYWSYMNYYLPKMEALVKGAFQEELPPMETLMKEKDLILLNEHVSVGYPRAYPPYVIPVGGMHAKETNGSLPKEMEDFIAGVDQFVYISFGSVVKVSKLPKEMQQTLFDAVASIPNTRFLWKWEGKIPENLPKNVLAKNWFPQQDVLGNRKCKGFVTQGGAVSFQQAAFHAVPVVVVPGFGDQEFQARSAVHHGFGIHLELSDITVETFSGAIRQILENEKYSLAVKEASKRFKDRPLPAVDTAVYWVEYVLRHDTSHLRPEGIKQTWWQRRSLDLWFLVFCLFLVLAILPAMCVVACVRFLLEKSSPKAKLS